MLAFNCYENEPVHLELLLEQILFFTNLFVSLYLLELI